MRDILNLVRNIAVPYNDIAAEMRVTASKFIIDFEARIL